MNQAEYILEQRRQAAELAELRSLCEELLRRLLDRDDRRAALVLLPLAYELLGDADFTARSLLACAFDSRSPEGQALRELAKDVSGDAEPDENARSLGRLLKRTQGAPLAGLRLEPRGETRDGLAWRLVRVSRV